MKLASDETDKLLEPPVDLLETRDVASRMGSRMRAGMEDVVQCGGIRKWDPGWRVVCRVVVRMQP